MKKKRLFNIVLLLFVGVIFCFVGSTYAKYTSSITKTSSVAIAKWNFYKDNLNQTFNINLQENYDESTLISSRNEMGMEYKIIAPGTKGSFDVKLTNTSEVGADFIVSLDNIDNLPKNIKFYKDENYQTELIPGSSKITGSLKANDKEGLILKIYWKWPYEAGTLNDGVYSGDTLDNELSISGEILKVKVTIKGVQALPGKEAITSHID